MEVEVIEDISPSDLGQVDGTGSLLLLILVSAVIIYMAYKSYRANKDFRDMHKTKLK